jgi:hypothetical protein
MAMWPPRAAMSTPAAVRIEVRDESLREPSEPNEVPAIGTRNVFPMSL